MEPGFAEPGLAEPGLDELAARLAPDVLREAVAEAREVARGQLVQLLAQEITRAALERRAAVAPPTARLGPGSEPAEALLAGGGAGTGEGGHRGRTQALYAYGIVPAGTPLTDLTGLADGTEVDAVTRGGVSLVVSVIDPELLRDVEEDLSETGPLAALARRHDQVLRDLQDRGSVLPLRFGTVLPGPREACGILEDPDGELPRALGTLRGTREWGFRLEAAEPAGTSPADEATPSGGVTTPDGVGPQVALTGATPPGAGAAYLSARRDELREQERQREETTRLVERVHRELLGHARDAARRPGRPGRVFDCAYLVGRDDEQGFADAAERVGQLVEDAGYTAAVTGPWPPYSFVHLTLGGRDGSGRVGDEPADESGEERD